MQIRIEATAVNVHFIEVKTALAAQGCPKECLDPTAVVLVVWAIANENNIPPEWMTSETKETMAEMVMVHLGIHTESNRAAIAAWASS